jgi:hypothetical protein
MSKSSIPEGTAGDCFLTLGALGTTATSTEIRRWLLRQKGKRFTADQVRGALNYLTRPPLPLAEMAERLPNGRGRPGLWRLTKRGLAVYAARSDP